MAPSTKADTRTRAMDALAAELRARGITAGPGADRRHPSRITLSGPPGPPRLRTTAVVRSNNGFPGWQMSLDPFLDILDGDGRQTIRLKPLDRPDEIYILVWLGERRAKPNRYFLITAPELQELVRAGHQWWLDQHGGTRPEKPESTHFTLMMKHLDPFENRWDKLFHA